MGIDLYFHRNQFKENQETQSSGNKEKGYANRWA